MGHVTQQCSVYQSYMSGRKLWDQMSDNHRWRVLVTYLPKSNFSGQVGNVALCENRFLLILTLENTAVFEWNFCSMIGNTYHPLNSNHWIIQIQYRYVFLFVRVFPICPLLHRTYTLHIAIIIFEDNFMISKVYRESWLIYHFCSLGLLNC